MSPSADASDAYARMLERFRQRMRAESRTLGDALDALRQQGEGWSGHEALRRLAHQLAGLGGTFGFEAVSAAGLGLEDALLPARGRHDLPAIEAAAEGLLQALARADRAE
jgi:HPt (histidine-containing phosphotransfer) domain-containing protein